MNDNTQRKDQLELLNWLKVSAKSLTFKVNKKQYRIQVSRIK